MDNEFYISLSGIITFKNSDLLRKVISCIPLKWILIETDSPFLAPIPYRGKTNEPSYVKYVGEYLSNLYKISIKEVSSITDDNFYKLFSRQFDIMKYLNENKNSWMRSFFWISSSLAT